MLMDLPSENCVIYNYYQKEPDSLPSLNSFIKRFAKNGFSIDSSFYNLVNVGRRDGHKNLFPSTNFGL